MASLNMPSKHKKHNFLDFDTVQMHLKTNRGVCKETLNFAYIVNQVKAIKFYIKKITSTFNLLLFDSMASLKFP